MAENYNEATTYSEDRVDALQQNDLEISISESIPDMRDAIMEIGYELEENKATLAKLQGINSKNIQKPDLLGILISGLHSKGIVFSPAREEFIFTQEYLDQISQNITDIKTVITLTEEKQHSYSTALKELIRKKRATPKRGMSTPAPVPPAPKPLPIKAKPLPIKAKIPNIKQNTTKQVEPKAKNTGTRPKPSY